ncbi:MAG TPA: hypothetical protein VL242_08695 [Sorangium sp.]|nr:hypothetical protein [Sorangium sp.]
MKAVSPTAAPPPRSLDHRGAAGRRGFVVLDELLDHRYPLTACNEGTPRV